MTRNPKAFAREPHSVGRCDSCGKETYLSRKAAKIIAKRANPGNPGTAYRCPQNLQQWHVGHLSSKVKSGVWSR